MRPFSLIGHRDAKNLSLVTDARIQQAGASVMLGVHMQAELNGGYSDFRGIVWGVDTTGTWGLWPSIAAVGATALLRGTRSPLAVGSWHQYRMDINGSLLNVWIDGQPVVTNFDSGKVLLPSSGHGMIGTEQFGQLTQYDNFQLYSSYTPCSGAAASAQAGTPLAVVECSSEVGLAAGSQWIFNTPPNSPTAAPIQLRANPSLCVASVANSDPAQPLWHLQLASCDAADPHQQWLWYFVGVSPDNEAPSWIYHPLPSSGAFLNQTRCLSVIDENADIGSPMVAAPCDPSSILQSFWFDYAAGEIGNEGTATCLGFC